MPRNLSRYQILPVASILLKITSPRLADFVTMHLLQVAIAAVSLSAIVLSAPANIIRDTAIVERGDPGFCGPSNNGATECSGKIRYKCNGAGLWLNDGKCN
ncbi:hypothetical protein COCCADRAFT_24279 [Bipolaris zeicola 26-R-13]|uniref:Uncharacterized protein n=1 Tax=Cochliobolus carbonum (strain 26-R-13) TaxID=930089 RepID=W6YDV9_COCC2|nr:uncharacterized protein COCCADRAFT_24279 [Bipolaris zeicola 26-R-13]EUC35858.1 hypothetical protein COCCADRAFT_24279 [Bipolaris zeicola 26-R-13]